MWGILPIWHLLTGLLLTDFCCLDFSWLGLDICWLRHLLISANLPFADSTWTFADPDICWSLLDLPIKTFADQDICWFYQKSHLLTFFFKILFPRLLSFLVSFVAFPQFFALLYKCTKYFRPLWVFSQLYQKLFQNFFFTSEIWCVFLKMAGTAGKFESGFQIPPFTYNNKAQNHVPLRLFVGGFITK